MKKKKRNKRRDRRKRKLKKKPTVVERGRVTAEDVRRIAGRKKFVQANEGTGKLVDWAYSNSPQSSYSSPA